jgi:hypothetical protein
MSNKQEFTKSQLAFLEKHNITEDRLLNAEGSAMTEEVVQKMKDGELILAYNTSACAANKNHPFKTSEGNCPQCSSANLQSALKEFESGYVYIIGSVKAGLVKIGSTTEIVKRVKSLNSASSKFANCDDWEMLFYAKTKKIGMVVREIQEKLSNYLDTRQYNKSEKSPKANELFRCSFNKAKQAFTEVHDEQMIEFSQKVEKSGITDYYQFRNLIATAV